MDHNIRDRNDFYEKFYLFFAQLGEYEKDNGIFSATVTAIIQLLEHYINSPASDSDTLKPLLFLVKQKLIVNPKNGISNHDLLVNISGYMYKVRDYRKKADAVQLNLFTSPSQSASKPGVEFVFVQCPALERIGAASEQYSASELYSAYLDTIFPDSKIKDIVYHGTDTRFDRFDKKFIGTAMDSGTAGLGFYFNPRSNKYNAKYLMPVILDAKRPLFGLNHTIFDFGDRVEENGRWSDKIAINKKAIYLRNDFDKEFVRRALYRVGNKKIISNAELSAIFTEVIKSLGYDSVKHHSNLFNGEEIVVFEPEQAHILGTKQDIEMFKRFVAEQKSDSNIRTMKTA